MSDSDPAGQGYTELRPMAAAPDGAPAKGKDNSLGVMVTIVAIAVVLTGVGGVGYLIYTFS